MTYKLSDIQAILDERFILNKEFAEVMYLAVNEGLNVLLTGPAGHGKSERNAYLKERLGLGAEHFVVQCHHAMSYHEFYGGNDLSYYKETGRIRYNTELSWINYEYPVLEELGDASMRMATSMKDPLSSGVFMNDGREEQLKVRSLTATSNLTPEELSENESIRALFERFQLHLHVNWSSHSSDDYAALFEKVYDSELRELAIWISEQNDKMDYPISPRMALNLARLYQVDAKLAVHAAGFPPELMRNFVSDISQMRGAAAGRATANAELNNIQKAIGELKIQVDHALEFDNKDHMQECLNDIAEARDAIRGVNMLKMPTEVTDRVNAMFRELKKLEQSIKHNL